MKSKAIEIVESEMIERLALITGYSRQMVRDIIKAMTEFTLDEISTGTPVRIGNLGVITTIEAKSRGGFNFKTKSMNVPKTYNRVKFKPSRALKRAVAKLSGDSTPEDK